MNDSNASEHDYQRITDDNLQAVIAIHRQLIKKHEAEIESLEMEIEHLEGEQKRRKWAALGWHSGKELLVTQAFQDEVSELNHRELVLETWPLDSEIELFEIYDTGNCSVRGNRAGIGIPLTIAREMRRAWEAQHVRDTD